MIQKFVDRWDAGKGEVLKRFSKTHPEKWEDIFAEVFKLISDDGDKWTSLRLGGNYSGDLVFLMSEEYGSQYMALVAYGSCPTCDILHRIYGYKDHDLPTEEQTADYMMLVLHIIQGLKEINFGDSVNFSDLLSKDGS